MYADYNTAVSVRGTAEELAAIAEVLWEYKTKAVNISLSSIKTIEGEIDLFLASKEQFLSIVSSARDGFDVEASGPYGQYSDLGDVDLFKDTASALTTTRRTATVVPVHKSCCGILRPERMSASSSERVHLTSSFWKVS